VVAGLGLMGLGADGAWAAPADPSAAEPIRSPVAEPDGPPVAAPARPSREAGEKPAAITPVEDEALWKVFQDTLYATSDRAAREQAAQEAIEKDRERALGVAAFYLTEKRTRSNAFAFVREHLREDRLVPVMVEALKRSKDRILLEGVTTARVWANREFLPVLMKQGLDSDYHLGTMQRTGERTYRSVFAETAAALAEITEGEVGSKAYLDKAPLSLEERESLAAEWRKWWTKNERRWMKAGAGAKKPPVSGRPGEPRNASEVIRDLVQSHERATEAKAAKELGDRLLAGQLALFENERKWLAGYVEKQIAMTAAAEGPDRAEANLQIQRLWWLAADQLVEHLGDENLTIVEAATKNLILMRSEAVAQKIIARIQKGDSLCRKNAVLALGMMCDRRKCPVLGRSVMSDEASVAMAETIIVPFLRGLQEEKPAPELDEAIRTALRLLAKPTRPARAPAGGGGV